jgi:hypothetical protein
VTPDEAIVAVLAALDAAAIPYMIVGSLASNFHGIPRATRDADFVVRLSHDDLDRLEQHLAPGLRLDRQGAFEGVTGTLRHLIALSDSVFVCELFQLSDDPHDVERFARRRAAQVLGRQTFVATAEDMIVTKLRWAVAAGRSKDRDDVRNMLAVRGDDLDWPYLQRWCVAHRTDSLLQQIRASIPRP